MSSAIDRNAHVLLVQQAFRSLLDAMARPGEVHELPALDTAALGLGETGLFDASVLLAQIVLDPEVSFAVAGEPLETGSETQQADSRARVFLAALTYAPLAPIDEARFLFVPLACHADVARRSIEGASAGTFESPHLSATVFVECPRLGEGEAALDAHVFELSGPGVDGTARFSCARDDWARARAARHDEFPCGVDIVLCDELGRIVCVPRSSALRQLDGSAVAADVPSASTSKGGEL